MEESVLRLDEESGWLDISGTKAEADIEAAGEKIIAFLEEQEKPVTREDIEAGVEAQKKHIQKALPRLVEQGRIGRSGTGKRGDKYWYFSSSQGFSKNAQSREEPNLSNSEGLDPQNISSFLPPTPIPG